MSLTVSEGASGTYSPPEPGTFTAICCSVIDLGTQQNDYQGEIKSARKIMLTFEICDDANRRDDGSAHTINKRFTASLHPKSGMRKFLEAWRGRPFSADELRGFNVASLAGIGCLVGVVHETKPDGKVFANLSSCMRLPRGMTAAPGTEQPLVFDLDAPDWSAYARLGSRLQDQIAAAPEFQALQAAGRVPRTIPLAPATHQNAPQRAAAPQAIPAPHQHQKNAPAPVSEAEAYGSGFDDMTADCPF